jgi:Cu(I)-responsive transcriptional regulator
MKIGELARSTGTSAETIRYYERIGLLPKPDRTGSNYRDYGSGDVDRLGFIRHARGLGFDLSDIRSLIDLAEHPERDCGEADEIATRHLVAVEEKIQRLLNLRGELDRLVTQCRGGHAADCRILAALSDHRDCGSDHAPAAA